MIKSCQNKIDQENVNLGENLKKKLFEKYLNEGKSALCTSGRIIAGGEGFEVRAHVLLELCEKGAGKCGV